jgi:hypothetical protein
MSPDAAEYVRKELREMREDLAEVVRLQIQANGRLGKIEGRVFELELWRARLQGAAATSRVVWLLAGGAITGIAVSIFNNT